MIGLYGFGAIKHNNPGNIRLTNTKWKGKVPNSSNQNRKFEEFTSLDYGFRACMLNLISYVRKGYNTIDKIINRWAPASENSAASRANYKQKIASATGIGVNQKILAFDKDLMKNFVTSMASFEHGIMPNPIWVVPIDNAWTMVVSYLGDSHPHLALNSVTEIVDHTSPNPPSNSGSSNGISLTKVKITKKTVFITAGIGIALLGGYMLYNSYQKQKK